MNNANAPLLEVPIQIRCFKSQSDLLKDGMLFTSLASEGKQGQDQFLNAPKFFLFRIPRFASTQSQLVDNLLKLGQSNCLDLLRHWFQQGARLMNVHV